jgi:hypothetical protein
MLGPDLTVVAEHVRGNSAERAIPYPKSVGSGMWISDWPTGWSYQWRSTTASTGPRSAPSNPWQEGTPKGFGFALKGGRLIIYRLRLGCETVTVRLLPGGCTKKIELVERVPAGIAERWEVGFSAGTTPSSRHAPQALPFYIYAINPLSSTTYNPSSSVACKACSSWRGAVHCKANTGGGWAGPCPGSPGVGWADARGSRR